MTSHIEELLDNYQKLLDNFTSILQTSQLKDNQISDLTGKIRLINNEIGELNVKVNDLNLLMLENKIELTDDEKQELKNSELSNKTLKVFAPYILCYQMFQQNITSECLENEDLTLGNTEDEGVLMFANEKIKEKMD